MPFIPDTLYGAAYAMVGAWAFGTAFASMRPGNLAVAIVMLVHWVTMRGLDVYGHNNPGLWVLHDVATVICLAVLGWTIHSRLAFACAAVFFAVMLFDQWWWLFSGSFDANSAVAEAGGYLVFAMITGASIGISGTGYGGGAYRFGAADGSFESRGAISGRSTLSRNAMAKSQAVRAETRR